MDAAEVAGQISEAVEHERAEQRVVETFRTRAAIAIAVLAMLLAVTSLGGDNATKEAINHNILASDTWAFYQAKNVRQTANQIAANELEASLALHGAGIGDQARQGIQQNIDRYRATVARYESEPDPSGDILKGEGKKELMARARHFEEIRDHALKQDPNFDYALALFQIAIVLGSVSIVATSRPILALALVLGAAATVLMLNGFFLFIDLPIG